MLSSITRCLLIVTPASMAQSCSNGLSLREVKAIADPAGSTATLTPAIAKLVSQVAKIYACQEAVNHYAMQPGNIVESHQKDARDALIVNFSNKANSGRNVCGSIRYNNAIGSRGGDAAEIFAGSSGLVFVKFEGDIADQTSSMMQPIFPPGRNFPRPNAKFLSQVAVNIQANVAAAFRELMAARGWNDAQMSEFNKAAQCVPLPIALGPDEALLAKYPEAYADYKQVEPIIDTVGRE